MTNAYTPNTEQTTSNNPNTPAPQNAPIDFIDEFGARDQNTPNELIKDPPKRKRGQSHWSPERRAAASARARTHRPWRFSTGPRTARGKAVSSMNAYKHGFDSRAGKRFLHALREQGRFLREAKRWYKRRSIARALGLPYSPFSFVLRPAMVPACLPEQDKIRRSYDAQT
jgi:hypothetical protein